MQEYIKSLSGVRQEIPSGSCLDWKDSPQDDPALAPKPREQQCIVRPRPLIRDRLSFAEFDEVFEIPHFLEMTQGEIDDTWITPEEEDVIHQHCKSLISLISAMEADHNGDTKTCFRGLYEHAPSHMKKQEVTRQRIYDTVRVAQQYHSANHCPLPDIVLAKFCQKFSSASADAARVKGIADAVDALTC
jgi:hypothetical protein